MFDPNINVQYQNQLPVRSSHQPDEEKDWILCFHFSLSSVIFILLSEFVLGLYMLLISFCCILPRECFLHCTCFFPPSISHQSVPTTVAVFPVGGVGYCCISPACHPHAATKQLNTQLGDIRALLCSVWVNYRTR